MTAVEQFWGETVLAGPFASYAESEKSLAERTALYPELETLMPTKQPGKVVLDYGCGPGHDTLLFLQNGATRVYYADASKKALQITRQRLKLHGYEGGTQARSWYVSDSGAFTLPAVDYIHCAGVLHHVSNPWRILRAFRYALRPRGECRIMVYDGDSSEHTQSDVPITRWWTRGEVVVMAAEAGFQAVYLGSYECSAPWRPNCFAACYVLR